MRIAVFMGSNPGFDTGHLRVASELGSALAERGHGLVYGGGRVGLMGAVADAMLAAGGEVIGVIPDGMLVREVGHQGLTELRVVDSMHERKAVMAELADGFIALAGGLGTFEELFEQLTWLQLGIHAKPVVVLDPFDYYAGLFELLDRAVTDGFMRTEHRLLLTRAVSVDDAIDAVGQPTSVPVRKWLDGPPLQAEDRLG